MSDFDDRGGGYSLIHGKTAAGDEVAVLVDSSGNVGLATAAWVILAHHRRAGDRVARAGLRLLLLVGRRVRVINHLRQGDEA